MNNHLFYSLNDALKNEFGTKVIKLSLDGGFTCPNRDGSIDTRGCIFCSSHGSGDFVGNRTKTIARQMEDQINLLKPKWPDARYIAYFQNFTNTYGEVQKLREIYSQGIQHPDVLGLAIATRPDCLSLEVLNLLEELGKRTYLWVELGLQTIHSSTTQYIRRGYELPVYLDAMEELHKRNIKTVVHLILYLPHERSEDMIQSLELVCKTKPWGIKLQMLNVLQHTDLASIYLAKPFPLPTADEYIAFVSHLLTLTPKDIVIHRLTGDGDKKSLIAPLWVANKRYVLNGIHKYMRAHQLVQGKNSFD